MFPLFSDELRTGRSLRNVDLFTDGLILEPVPNTKGRFRRVGVFKYRSVKLLKALCHRLRHPNRTSFKDVPHLAAHAIDWVRGHPSYDTLHKAFTILSLSEQYYQDFDGIDQYTIEIV